MPERSSQRVLSIARDGVLDPTALRERVMHEARVLGGTL